MSPHRLPNKQVDKSHYDFSRYLDKARWNSIWHQVKETIELRPASVLEIGPGPGLFKALCGLFGVSVKTFDHDPELEPDYVGTIIALPFSEGQFDLVCAFQVLEHLPYEQSLLAFAEMARVARKHVLISLPDDRAVWPYSIHVPKLGAIRWLVPRPFWRPRIARFDGEHYWEISKRGFALSKVVSDLSSICQLVKTYRVHEKPYHRLFLFSVNKDATDTQRP